MQKETLKKLFFVVGFFLFCFIWEFQASINISQFQYQQIFTFSVSENKQSTIKHVLATQEVQLLYNRS